MTDSCAFVALYFTCACRSKLKRQLLLTKLNSGLISECWNKNLEKIKCANLEINGKFDKKCLKSRRRPAYAEVYIPLYHLGKAKEITGPHFGRINSN